MALNRRIDTEFEKELFTGFFLAKVLSVNPDKAAMGKMFGKEMPDSTEEPVYEGKDKDGNETVTISFWLQAITPGKEWFNARFRLVDKKAVSEKKEGGEVVSSKFQYVNQTGGSSWCDDKKNLLDWFCNYQKETEKGSKVYENVAPKEVREAIQGEAGLYTFLTKWLAKVNWYHDPKSSEQSNILIDVKKAFRNINKYVADQYQPFIDEQIALDNETDPAKKKELAGQMLTDSVVCLATVYTGDKDGQPVHYQNVYQEYLAGWLMKKVQYSISSGNWSDKSVKKFHEQLTGQFGCKDAYTLTLLQPFDENEHLQSSSETFKDSTGGNIAGVVDTTY